MNELINFLRQQTILQVAPAGGEPWIANVLFVSDGLEKLYFFGSTERLYAQQMLADERVAFASAWHDPDSHLNRKGIQGVGRASVVEDVEEIRKAVELHNQKFTDFKSQVTEDVIRFDQNTSCIWGITADFIKFWNDEVYGINGSEKFSF